MPDGFAQPVPSDIWLPFDIPGMQRTAISGARQLTVYGRIADGKSFEMARADVNRFTARTIEANPADNKDYRYNIKTLRNVLLDGADSSALFVQAGAATLLVLAILNLASVLVAWGFERKQEMAVRRALGAGGGQVVRLLLQQSVVDRRRRSRARRAARVRRAADAAAVRPWPHRHCARRQGAPRRDACCWRRQRSP